MRNSTNDCDAAIAISFNTYPSSPLFFCGVFCGGSNLLRGSQKKESPNVRKRDDGTSALLPNLPKACGKTKGSRRAHLSRIWLSQLYNNLDILTFSIFLSFFTVLSGKMRGRKSPGSKLLTSGLA